jgi:HSP20 family molecular chaperone IbpA
MSFDDDFDDFFESLGLFNGKSSKKIQEEIDAILKEINSDKLEGTWETRNIDEPGMKGWVLMGRFRSDEELEPLNPLRPQKRRPMPEKPFETSRSTPEEASEPLMDIFEEEKATKIYLELPGEEKENIQLMTKDGIIEVKTKNFYKKIDLRNNNFSTEKMTTDYKNGVLIITLPKRTLLRKEDTEKQEMV